MNSNSKPSRRNVSLAPLTMEQALAAAMQVKPPAKKRDPKVGKRKGRKGNNSHT